MISGCATVREPENECRLSVLDGTARYGSLLNYVKGDGKTIRLVWSGEGCPEGVYTKEMLETLLEKMVK